MASRRTSWSRRASVWAGLITAFVLVSGCAGPAYTYVTNSADHTYLKVPNTWRPIDQKAIDDALGLDTTVADSQRGLWLGDTRPGCDCQNRV